MARSLFEQISQALGHIGYLKYQDEKILIIHYQTRQPRKPMWSRKLGSNILEVDLENSIWSLQYFAARLFDEKTKFRIAWFITRLVSPKYDALPPATVITSAGGTVMT